MDRFEQPDFEPETLVEREAAQIGWYGIRKAAERLNLKNELVEAFYQIGYSLHGERFLRDSGETEYEFKSGDVIIKVIAPNTTFPSSEKGVGTAQNVP